MGTEQPKITVRIRPLEEGGYLAECPEIPGCYSQGETIEEAEANIRLAVEACLSVMFESDIHFEDSL